MISGSSGGMSFDAKMRLYAPEYLSFHQKLAPLLSAQNMRVVAQPVKPSISWPDYTTSRMGDAAYLTSMKDDAQRDIALIGENSAVLDLGTGTGHYLLELASLAKQRGIHASFTGVDIILPHFFEEAKINYALAAQQMTSYTQQDIKNFAFEENSYTLINAPNVLYYLEVDDQIKIIEKIASSLATGGVARVRVKKDYENNDPLHHSLDDEAFFGLLDRLKDWHFFAAATYAFPDFPMIEIRKPPAR